MNIKDIKGPEDIVKISQPADIKEFPIKDLNKLSGYIREFLINSISKTGGHLGSSLGTVDLITALHYEFDSPNDKLIFDVGHQAYTHKILTGRANKFDTLRQYKGISGFLKRSESKHDVWESGHASNSISAAIGYAIANDLNNNDSHVISIIGDGSMTNGMSLEALNHLIEINKKVIIIINDNEMSISNNIGFIDKMFKGLQNNVQYDNTKSAIKKSLDKIDRTHTTTKTLSSLKNKVKNEIHSAQGFFNVLGFKYYGPIDGHDIPEMLKYFKLAKKYDGPIVLHIKTIKGKGYLPAEKNSWHSIPKFDIKTGEFKNKNNNITNSYIVSNTMKELMREDEDIIIITPAMIEGSELKDIEEKFPNRITDVGIAEEHATSLAAGLALANKKPFLAIYSTFLQRSYDQIFQDIVRQKCNVVVGIDRAGIVGADGETHQGIYDVSFLSHMPNVTIMHPKDGVELKSLLKLSFKIEGPTFLRYSKNSINKAYVFKAQYEKIKLGEWNYEQKGNKINIISYGDDITILKEEFKNNKDISIINARFIKPLDTKMLKEIQQEKIIVLEENSRLGGLGNLILDYYNQNNIKPNMQILAIGEEFVQHGDVSSLKKEQKIDIEAVKTKVQEMIDG